MITVIYSTHKDKLYNDKFKKHLLDTIGVNNPQILEYENHNQYTLSNIYNTGIIESNYDIVVCCHNDIKLEKNWGKKLLGDFSNNPEYGIIGKAGSCYFPESGVYWENMKQTMVGQVYHHPEGQKKWISKYSPKLPFLIPAVTIDGLFISFDKTKIKHNFDESIGKFHFYDHLFCIPNFIDGVKIGVTSSFEITHQSVGQPNQEFWESRDKFITKYGSHLPIDLKPKTIYTPKIKENNFKKFGKVAIIIPTKGNVNMLFDCINSFYENSNSDLFDIFIADTGSSEDDKEWIKSNILNLGNIKLIEFDYYNFSKINNSVVKDIDKKYEFLLFCNNDIKILNDVIGGMLSVFLKNKNAGTVGCRLHYEDNTLQHDGITPTININNNALIVSHVNSKNYYNHLIGTHKVFGSTAALLMVRKHSFEKIGGFNENYISCFEDVELNGEFLKQGFTNYICSDCVAYHYESQTRGQLNQNESDVNLMVFNFKNNFDIYKHYTFYVK